MKQNCYEMIILSICQYIEYKKNWIAKITKLFAYKICTLISLKKFFANDKHVNYHLIEKQTQKICRRICHNNDDFVIIV